MKFLILIQDGQHQYNKMFDKCKNPLLKGRNKMHIINQYSYAQTNTEFIVTINTSLGAGSSIQLPLPVGQTYNFTVDYGDGSPLKTVTAYNDPNASYTYSMDGVYQIKIKGKCGGWSVNNTGDKLKFTSVVQWGEVRFDYINGMFRGCTNLTTIPDGEIPLTTNCASAAFAFAETDITIFYNGLFVRGTNITSFASTFYFIQNEIVIPSDIFRYNTLAELFVGTFYRSNITSIPSDIFRYNVMATSFSQCFQWSYITSIPLDIFRYNTLVTNFNSVFYQTYGLYGATIPEDIFYYNALVTNYNRAFFNTRNLTLPTRMFNLSNLSIVSTYNEFMSQFSVSYSNTGTVQDIWNYATSATHANTFLNQTGLTNYASIPNDWKGL